MAKSRIVVVEGQNYLVPRKKYKKARKSFSSQEETWAHIMDNIEEFGRPLVEEAPEEEPREKPKPKKKAEPEAKPKGRGRGRKPEPEEKKRPRKPKRKSSDGKAEEGKKSAPKRGRAKSV